MGFATLSSGMYGVWYSGGVSSWRLASHDGTAHVMRLHALLLVALADAHPASILLWYGTQMSLPRHGACWQSAHGNKKDAFNAWPCSRRC